MLPGSALASAYPKKFGNFVAEAWAERSLREAVLADCRSFLTSRGFRFRDEVRVSMLENSETFYHFVVPHCGVRHRDKPAAVTWFYPYPSISLFEARYWSPVRITSRAVQTIVARAQCDEAYAVAFATDPWSKFEEQKILMSTLRKCRWIRVAFNTAKHRHIILPRCPCPSTTAVMMKGLARANDWCWQLSMAEHAVYDAVSAAA
jgi:hypothetical protein